MTVNTEQVTLDTLSLSTPATIVRVGGEKAARRRLLDMGMVSGEQITVHRIAPMGDPIDVVVKGYHLSLRKHEARQITVEVNHDAAV